MDKLLLSPGKKATEKYLKGVRERSLAVNLFPEEVQQQLIPKIPTKMPVRRYKRRSYKRPYRRYMDPGVRAVTASLRRAVAYEKKVAAIKNAEALLAASGTTAVANATALREKAKLEGRGSYKFGRRLQKFGEGAFGGALKGHAMTLMDRGMSALQSQGGMSGMGMYTGRGDYTGNSLIDEGMGVADEVPYFRGSGDETGAVTVCRKEYVGEIYGPGTPLVAEPFAIQSFSLNPGLEATFPWLSQIAQNYDEYEFIQLMFTYRSTTTDIGNSTTGQCGSVIMTTNYNAAAAPFSDKVTMMEYDASMSCKTTETMRHGVECDPSKLSGAEGKYIRNNPVVTQQDLKTYDHGLFQIAVANAPSAYASLSLGELWVSYNVVLRKPKFYASKGLGISQDIYVSGSGTTTTARLMGSQAGLLQGQQNNINTKLTITNNVITITFPASYAGTLELKLTNEQMTTTGAAVIFSQTGNITNISDLYAAGVTGDTTPSFYQTNTNQAITSSFGINVVHLNIAIASNGINNTFTFTTQNVTVAPTQSMLTISEYNSGFSYKAANIGPIGAQSNSPVLVNSQGIVVVPS